MSWYKSTNLTHLLCWASLSAWCPRSRRPSPSRSIWPSCKSRWRCCWRTTRYYCQDQLCWAPKEPSRTLSFFFSLHSAATSRIYFYGRKKSNPCTPHNIIYSIRYTYLAARRKDFEQNEQHQWKICVRHRG